MARVTSRLPTSKPLRARPRGNCSFSLRSSALKRAWLAGPAGSRRHVTAPPSGNRSLLVASVQHQSPEDFRSPEGCEAGRRVLCRLQPGSLALHLVRPVSPFSYPRPPSPSARGTFRRPSPQGGSLLLRACEPGEGWEDWSPALDPLERWAERDGGGAPSRTRALRPPRPWIAGGPPSGRGVGGLLFPPPFWNACACHRAHTLALVAPVNPPGAGLRD